MADFKFKKSGLFAAGVLFGTAGIKILTSKDAKNEERAAAEEAVEDVETEAEETADEDAFKETAEETAE